MRTTAIIYGSTTGNTKSVAEAIALKLSNGAITMMDAAHVQAEELERFENLILGASTWGMGDLQDDWEALLPKLAGVNLQGKTIALFGLGDAVGYPDTFVDALGTLYEALEGKGCQFVGFTDASAYSFEGSRASRNGMLVGLALDEDNEAHLSESRIEAWVASIRGEL